MSGEFVTLADAKIMIGRAAPGAQTFYIDLANLQTYITNTGADQILIQPGIDDVTGNTIVVTCLQGGNPVYYMQDGVQYVLEHINTNLAI